MLSRTLTYLAVVLLAATGGLATKSPGCGKSSTLKSGMQANINVAGQSRQWILRIPSNYNSSHPYRLIFGLHWLNGHYTDVDNNQFYGLEPLAGNSAIFVAPNGLNAGWANNNGNDVTFIKNLISLVENDLCVDQSLRYSVGWSYGGSMSYSLACSLGSQLRAIGVLSGAQLSGCAGGSMPVAYYGQHGVRDTVLPIADGRALRDHFVKVNGCTQKTAPEPAANSGTHIKTVYDGCSAGHPVTWIAFDGPHEPEASDRTGSEWTSGEVWNFFSQFQSQ